MGKKVMIVIWWESGLFSASWNHLITFADHSATTHVWDCVPR